MSDPLTAAILELFAERDAEESRMRRHGASGHVLAAYREATDDLKRALRRFQERAAS